MASDQGQHGLVCTCGVEEQALSLPEIDSRLLKREILLFSDM